MTYKKETWKEFRERNKCLIYFMFLPIRADTETIHYYLKEELSKMFNWLSSVQIYKHNGNYVYVIYILNTTHNGQNVLIGFYL